MYDGTYHPWTLLGYLLAGPLPLLRYVPYIAALKSYGTYQSTYEYKLFCTEKIPFDYRQKSLDFIVCSYSS